jgi:hypothetical protein
MEKVVPYSIPCKHIFYLKFLEQYKASFGSLLFQMSLNLFKFRIRFELWLQSTRQALLAPLARRAVPSPRGAARASGEVEPLPAPASFAIRAPQHPPSFSLLAGRPRGSAPRRRLSPHPAVVDSPVRIPSASPSGMRSCPKFH